MEHTVTTTWTRDRVTARCTCGWTWTRRRAPAGPGDDLPDRHAAELHLAAQTVTETHLRRAL